MPSNFLDTSTNQSTPIKTCSFDDKDELTTALISTTEILNAEEKFAETPFSAETTQPFRLDDTPVNKSPIEHDSDLVPPITETDIRLIAAALHDQGRGHVLSDMIESVTGERPDDALFTPRKMRIRHPENSKARKKFTQRKYDAKRRAHMTPEEKSARIENLERWRTNNPDKLRATATRRLEKKKAARKSRELVAVDLEGFDTGRYFTDDRPDYDRQYIEGLAEGKHETEQGLREMAELLKEHGRWNGREEQPAFAGWTPHGREWYLDQHDLTDDDPVPSARNKKRDAPPIYNEHRPFLFGAGNDREQYFLPASGPVKKTPLSGVEILNAICDLPKRFGKARYITFAFGYDVAQILRCLDIDTAGKLQAGQIVVESVDDDGAPCEEVIEMQTFFWNEFAIAYRRGKMFRVGRLKDPANPYIYTKITNPEKRQAYIDAGREPVTRKINYRKGSPVTLNDTFGFFQMSFIEAYEGSQISFTLEEAKIIVEGKRNRNIMASLPMNEVIEYQGMELRILCRMMNKLTETTTDLGLKPTHLQGAGAISAAMANKHRSKDFYPKIKANNISPMQEWAHYCFAGGHIEMIKQGRHTDQCGPLHGDDITGAYPSKQYLLPAMALPIEWELKKDGSLGKVTKRVEGKWIWREGGELNEDIIKTMSAYSMIETEFAFSKKGYDRESGMLRDAPFYPLFYRTEDGSILFPANGIGRYYRDEILQAFDWVRRMRPDMNETQHARMIKLRGGWEYICPTIDDLTAEQLQAIKTNCPTARIGDDGLIYPFQYIKDYCDQRLLYPKTDTRNQILKLGVNGSWGKTAQSVGGRSGMPPSTASPWYAGVVTAQTRAQVMDAMLNAPWNIIHVATDGLQSDAPLHIESKDKILGTWEMDVLTKGVYIKPGIYAFVGEKKKQIKDEITGLESLVASHVYKGKSRGVGLRSILGENDPKQSGKENHDSEAKRDIQEEWFRYLDNLASECYSKGRSIASLPHKKLVTFGLAASNPSLWPMVGNWVEDRRVFEMNEAGVKRGVCIDHDKASGLVITSVASNKTPKALSAKHKPEWLDKANEAILRDLNENADLALAHDWDVGWDVGEE